MKKQHIWLFGIAILIGVAAITLLRKHGDSPSSARQVFLTALIPLTGPSANFGQDDREAISLAVDHFRKKNPDVHVSVDFQDTKSDKGQALTALSASIARRKPNILFVESSGASLAVIPLVNQHEILTISVAAHPDVTRQSSLVFRCLPTASQESEFILRHAVERKNLKRISLLTLNNDYGASYIEPFKEVTRRLSADLVLVEQYNPSDSDFRALCTKIAATSSEALFVVGYGRSMGILIRQIREQGYKGALLTTSGVIYPEVLAEAGVAAHGLQYADVPFRTNSSNQMATQFAADYHQRFRRSPTPFASTVYDGILMGLDALWTSNLKPALAASNLIAQGRIDGANGAIGISMNRDMLFGLEIRTIDQ